MRTVAALLFGLAMASAGCSKPDPVTEPAPAGDSSAAVVPTAATLADLGGPEWKLESFTESEPVPAGITITLAVAGEQISGQGGCNRYMGSLKNADAPGRIAVGPLATTRMACSPQQNDAELRYTKALQQAVSFAIQEGRLRITYQDGDSARTLIYSRA